MAYAAGSGKSVKTSGTVGGSGEISTHVTAIKAGTNVTLTSDANRVVTIASTGGGSGGNTLDQAYDQGGSGSGRIITADSGAVKIVGDAAQLLHLAPTVTSNIPIQIDADFGTQLVLQSEDAGNILSIAGPIQTSLQTVVTGNTEKVTEPTAMDLSVGATDKHHTAQGEKSALIGGIDNKIAEETQGGSGSQPESVASSDSTRAKGAIIGGGSQNQIFSASAFKTANYAGVFAGFRNTVNYSSDTPNLAARNNIGGSVEQSVVVGGAANTVINGENNIIGGGSGNAIHTNNASAIIGGDSNLIDVPNAGTLSASRPINNAIIGGESNSIKPATATPYDAADLSTHLGQNNIILGGKGNEVNDEAKNCVLMGDSAAAGTDASNSRNDNSVLYIGGRFASGLPTSDQSTDNAFMFPGISSKYAGTSDAGKGYADSSFSGGGADYAEMFEWNDGNPNDEDRVGLFAKISRDGNLPNGKIEVGGDGMIVGPVSSMPGMVVNNPGMRWNSKFVVDDFGRFALDSDGNRQLNPNYDSTLNYQGRSGRKEWSPIALKGRVRVRASSNIGIYPSNKTGLTVNVNADGTVSDAGAKGKYKVLQVVKQKEIWSGPQGLFRSRDLVQDHGYGVVEILVE